MTEDYREDDDLDLEINQLFFRDDQTPYDKEIDDEIDAHFAGELTIPPPYASTIHQAAFTHVAPNAGAFTIKDNNIPPQLRPSQRRTRTAMGAATREGTRISTTKLPRYCS